AAGLAGQDPARAAHVARDDHGLAELLVLVRKLGMAGRKSARGALAVHPKLALLPVVLVLLELGDVVRHVVDKVHLQLLPGAAENRLEALAGLPHEELPVAPGKIGRGPHGAQVLLPLRTMDRRADEL